MTDNSKIAFVILHYQNIDVTRVSIRHLLELNGIEENEIIVVDNASPNNTGVLLKEDYSSYKNIHVIVTPKNGGFAYGNNIGYKEAREKYGCQIIVVMNSDVNIKDKNFICSLRKIEKNEQEVAIVAPDIVVKNGYHQNPYMEKEISTFEQKKIILKKKIGYILYGIPGIGSILFNRKSVQNFEANRVEKVTKKRVGIVPHGACVIYMPVWTRKEEFAFVEGTFLFVEEELLYDYCRDKQYSTCYIPELIVYHMEDASQNMVNKSGLQKKRNQMKYEIQSRELLINKRK